MPVGSVQQSFGSSGVNPAQKNPAQVQKEQRLQRINDLLARVDVLVSQFKFVNDRLKRNLQGTQAKEDAVFAKTLTVQQASATSVSSLLTTLRSSLETYKKQVAGEKSETAETAENLKTIRDTTSQLATETDSFLKAEEAANQGKKSYPTSTLQQDLATKANKVASETTSSLFSNMDLSRQDSPSFSATLPHLPFTPYQPPALSTPTLSGPTIFTAPTSSGSTRISSGGSGPLSPGIPTVPNPVFIETDKAIRIQTFIRLEENLKQLQAVDFGISREGMTCYLIAGIQTLFNTNLGFDVLKALVLYPQDAHFFSKKRTSEETNVFYEFRNELLKLFETDPATLGTDKPMQIKPFISAAVKFLGIIVPGFITNRHSDNWLNQQSDSGEVLAITLDSLLPSNTSPLYSKFCRLRETSTVTRDVTEKQRDPQVEDSPYVMFTFFKPDKSIRFSEFQKQNERITGTEQLWQLDSTGSEKSSKTDATRILEYSSLKTGQQIYCFKRMNKDANSKIKTSVIFNPSNLPRFVHIHQGTDLDSGHYIVAKRNDDGSWTIKNDSSVHVIKTTDLDYIKFIKGMQQNCTVAVFD